VDKVRSSQLSSAPNCRLSLVVVVFFFVLSFLRPFLFVCSIIRSFVLSFVRCLLACLFVRLFVRSFVLEIYGPLKSLCPSCCSNKPIVIRSIFVCIELVGEADVLREPGN